MSKETQNSVLFREQARAWLTLTQPSKDGAPQVFSASGRRVVVADRVDCPDHYRLRETLLVRGDFLCGSGSRFEGPVYVGGDCTIGKGSTFEVLCVEGKLHFSPNTEVKQWVHSFGPMDLRSGTWIAGAATSSHSIQVGVGSGAALLFAPEVASSGRVSMGSDVPPVTTFLEIPAPSSGREPELGGVRGFDIRKLSALGAETWVYDGSLHLSQPVLLGAKLVVRGSFVCPPGSLLEDDLKCGGSLRIGAGTISRGNLISRGEVTLEEECLFSGDIEAGTYLRLCSGVRGFRDAGPVSLVSGDRIIIEPNVVVRGRLQSKSGIRSMQPALEGGLSLLLAENS